MGGNSLLLCFAFQFDQFLTGVKMPKVIKVTGNFVEMIVGNGMFSGAVEPTDSRNKPVKRVNQNLL